MKKVILFLIFLFTFILVTNLFAGDCGILRKPLLSSVLKQILIKGDSFPITVYDIDDSVRSSPLIIDVGDRSGQRVVTGAGYSPGSLSGVRGYPLIEVYVNKNFENIPYIANLIKGHFGITVLPNVKVSKLIIKLVFGGNNKEDLFIKKTNLEKGKNVINLCELNDINFMPTYAVLFIDTIYYTCEVAFDYTDDGE